ncbi:MAG: hypothetical protein U9N77_05015 [Thermodesulfobacteriota bacterium]|nr:hypothetical protein [Thermodesulfobacteriota bacterium]
MLLKTDTNRIKSEKAAADPQKVSCGFFVFKRAGETKKNLQPFFLFNRHGRSVVFASATTKNETLIIAVFWTEFHTTATGRPDLSPRFAHNKE